MSRAALLAAALAAALIGPGCAAVPVAVAVGAMGAIPGDKDTAEGAAPAEAASPRMADAAPEREREREPEPEPDVAPLTGLASLRPGALPAQELPPGACGLFLFSRDAAPQFLAYAPADGETLTLNLDGVRMLRADAPLQNADDAFEQTYSSGAVTARLSAVLGVTLPEGRRVPEASLRLSGADGAALVIPMGGLVACEAANPA